MVEDQDQKVSLVRVAPAQYGWHQLLPYMPQVVIHQQAQWLRATAARSIQQVDQASLS